MKASLSDVFAPKFFTCLKSYKKEQLMTDLMAGLIVGIVALPLAIAFAIASNPAEGVPPISPERGIITAIVAGLLISLFGGSKVQIGGPTGAFIPIICGIIGTYGFDGLCIATFMAGIFLILLGVCRLGNIIKFIPYPIVIGFTSGIAVTIFTTQIKELLGLSYEGGADDFLGKWALYFQNLNTIDWPSALVGILSILIIVFMPKISKKIPGSLVAIVVMTVAGVLLKNYAGIDSIGTIGDRFGDIKAEIPSTVNFSSINFDTIKGLLSPAFTIAILGAIESLLSAAVADGAISDHHDSNTELIGQGLANLASPLFGGIPATGAIARTMTNINNGGRTPIAGVIHAIVLLLIFLFFMPLAKYIPMACLAGVLVVVSYNMSGWRSFLAQTKNPKSDVAVLLVTFFLTVIFDLTIAIEVGIVLACLLFMRRIASVSDVKIISDEIDPNSESDMLHVQNDEHLIIPEGVEVYEINGPFFFGAGNKFEELMGSFGDRPKVRIIRMRKVPFIDSTGLHNLENLCVQSQNAGIRVILSGVNRHVENTLMKAKMNNVVGDQNICSNINLALERAKAIIAEA